MNKWVQKSIKLANSKGYLDRLNKIYPVGGTFARDIPEEKLKKIKDFIAKKDFKNLLPVLLSLERFPIDDSYIGFLRKDKSAISKNPKTIKRLKKILLGMGEKGIIAGASRPKSASRQLGQMFRNWLKNIGYPYLSADKFWAYKKIAILQGNDNALRKFAHEKLNYEREKGLDLIIKIKNRFIIGEAKFISTSGGGQGGGFREAINFLKQAKAKRDVIRIAVLDGVIWLVPEGKSKNKSRKASLFSQVLSLNKNEIALSALLLEEFIKTL
jgi:hypothetical protein